MTGSELIELAKDARERAYAPYSGFFVGAAVESADGRVFTGCNIENASFSPTCCAERVAIFKAVSEGVKDFSAIAVVGGKAGESADAPCYPCGVCRQVMAEFCAPDTAVYFADGSVMTVEELLPRSFDLN